MTDARSGAGDIERTLRLLWGHDAEPVRGPRRSLSVAAIVDKAIEIADARGLDAVSIRTVAAELGVGAMTLYRYIPGKAELLDLMLDRVGRPTVEPLPRGWRRALETIAREMWRLYTTHPWLPFVDQSRPVLGPNAVHSLDLVMGALRCCDLTDQEKVGLTVTIESFITSLARTANAIAEADARTAESHDAFWRLQEATLTAAMESGRYPHMAALGEDAFAASIDETFELGLTLILDGVQARLDRRARLSAARRPSPRRRRGAGAR